MAAIAHPDRNFKYWLISPAIFLLLLIGLFPLIFSLVVSFMRVSMLETDTSFAGLVNYVQIFRDARLWQSLVHTMLIMVVALPIELLLGLAMAYLFLDHMPARQILVSLLMLPTIISPIVAGATWRLLFDNRYGPINQIIGRQERRQQPGACFEWIISQRMMPPVAIAFPVFLLYVWLGWVDTYIGLITLYTAFSLPYVIWMMRGYIEDIPLELEESALIDGCSRWEVLWKVVFPMARSGLFATAVFTFVCSWNDFLFALVLTRTEVTTYTV